VGIASWIHVILQSQRHLTILLSHKTFPNEQCGPHDRFWQMDLRAGFAKTPSSSPFSID